MAIITIFGGDFTGGDALAEDVAKTLEVRAYCHSENLAAHAVARKCGMEHRGVARNKNTGLEYELFVRPVS